MDYLKGKIVQKLEHLTETSLQKVLDFVDFLTWRQLKLQEMSHEQPSQKDLTKMVSTERVLAAFEAAWNEAEESKKVFFSNARLDEEAKAINEWKSKITLKTGNKYAETFKAELFALVPEVAVGNPVAAKKAAEILVALQQLADEGTHPRVSKAEAEKFANAFSKAVENVK